MPAINKIRLTNVVYEEGNKRYNDELFLFGGHNAAILLENGGGKTVFIQTVLQGIIPHTDLAGRQIKNTLVLENSPAHIAIEWILNEKPRRYVVTAVTLFITKDGLDSLRYVYEYDHGDKNGIEYIPFVKDGTGGKRPSGKGEMQDYYHYMKDRFPLRARTFPTIKEYRKFIEDQYHLISDVWDSIVTINSSEGGVEAFFESCKNTTQLFDRLLIPIVEKSIAGHNPNLFADMFEKQHDSLKQYKKLKEMIEENKRISKQLEQYVQTFEKLHSSLLSYEKAKQKAKGIWETIQIQKTETITQQENLEQRLRDWEAKDRQYKAKEASYQIAEIKESYESLRQEFEQANAKYSNKKEELDRYNIEYYSLKFARCKQQLHQFQEEVAFIEKEMEKLNEKEDLQQLKDQLEKAEQSFLGYFIEKIEGFKKQMEQIQYELNPILEQIHKIQQDILCNQKNEQEKQKELARVQNKIQTRTSDMKRLEQFLLSNPNQEQVETKLEQWQQRYQFLDDEIIRLKEEIKNKEKEQNERIQYIENQKEQKRKIENTLQKVQLEKKQIDHEQEEVIQILGKIRPQWLAIVSLYEHEQSIYHRLDETIEKLNKEKDELLYKERVARRFEDDYMDQKIFFSDPIIEQRIKTWKNQLDYCVTGIEYVQLSKEFHQDASDYPLWAVTLITTKKSKEALKKKVSETADQLCYPIQILTTEEAATINKETKQPEEDWVIPSYWQKGMEHETFQKWKEKIHMEAEGATANRIAKENEMKEWDNALRAYQNFMEKYPYEKMTLLHKKVSEHMIEIDQIKREIEINVQKQEDLRRQIVQIEERIEHYKEERQGLERKIEKGYDYLKYSQEVKDTKEREKQLTKEIQEMQMKLHRLKNQLEDLTSQKEFLTDRKKKCELEINGLENDEDYKEIRHLKPIFTGESKKIIQEKIQGLNMKIHQVNRSYGELNAKLINAKENISRMMDEMIQLKEENEKLEEELNFPPDGEELLRKINRKINETKKEIHLLENIVKEKSSEKDVQKGVYKNLVDRFHLDYPDFVIHTFTEPLEKVNLHLKNEKKNLQEEKKYLYSQLEQVKREHTFIVKAEDILDRFIEKHHFNAPHVEAIPLSNDEKMEFYYNRKKFAQSIIQELEQTSQEVDVKKEEVDKQKQIFKRFCTTISDVKLRKMAENGIEYKTNYEDLLQFKNNMMTSMERAANYANEHIRQKDEELQAFINQIHAHLNTVIEELKQIPKYTKIKVEEKWKNIYIFTIPEWKEDEGKQRIRDHIEWIMAQLESDRYVKEDGMQDKTEIRKDIEMWLQTKQLLQKVMNNEGMKVNCRKVTNENKVTTRSFSWEQSNVWSGGEKWSKNMTLFLGLLNYVAEKKQHNKGNMKHSRAVILDNPFGKASSEHVLNPVFFVAEQLGFQIIALTAHSEGKFLQDYFPVIYSCRLREAKKSKKQIITKEKWLHSAYFQDHDPEDLERLSETEQISLF